MARVVVFCLEEDSKVIVYICGGMYGVSLFAAIHRRRVLAGDRETDGKDSGGDDITMQYVNYHSGASDNGNYNSRGSAGCITCHPDDAEDFFGNFNWTNNAETTGDSSGTINVVRGGETETNLQVWSLKTDGKLIKMKNFAQKIKNKKRQ